MRYSLIAGFQSFLDYETVADSRPDLDLSGEGFGPPNYPHRSIFTAVDDRVLVNRGHSAHLPDGYQHGHGLIYSERFFLFAKFTILDKS